MKTIFKYVAIVAVCLFAFNVVTMAGGKNPSQVSKLPSTAQQFVKKHFSKCKVIDVLKICRIAKLMGGYEIELTNGLKVDMSKNGGVKKVR